MEQKKFTDRPRRASLELLSLEMYFYSNKIKWYFVRISEKHPRWRLSKIKHVSTKRIVWNSNRWPTRWPQWTETHSNSVVLLLKTWLVCVMWSNSSSMKFVASKAKMFCFCVRLLQIVYIFFLQNSSSLLKLFDGTKSTNLSFYNHICTFQDFLIYPCFYIHLN